MNELRVLLIEDSEADADLILRELRKAGYSLVSRRIEKAQELKESLAREIWDAVLCDHALPEFNSTEALSLLREKDPDLPFIIVSGHIGEDAAVDAMKAGANDYIMKDNLKRLIPAVQREIREAQVRRERKKAEEKLRKREDELRVARQIEKLKDEFIGMVSHELKTPLTVIIGALNVAETKGISTEECNELMHSAATSAEELYAMVDNLLELSRYQSNRLGLHTQQTQIEPMVRDVVRKFKDRSAIHNFVTDISSGLPPVIIDPLRVERVLNNLIENAIKYSPKGGDIKVAVRPEKSQMVISVSDRGIGISPEDQERLFQAFERLGVDNKHGIGGVGLGLRVCQILVEAHKGRIWVESAQGRGSTFHFTLPVAN